MSRRQVKTAVDTAVAKALRVLTDVSYRNKHNTCVIAGSKLLRDLSKHVVFQDLFIHPDSAAQITDQAITDNTRKKRHHVEKATASSSDKPTEKNEEVDDDPKEDKSHGNIHQLTEKEKRKLRASLAATPSKTVGGALDLHGANFRFTNLHHVHHRVLRRLAQYRDYEDGVVAVAKRPPPVDPSTLADPRLVLVLDYIEDPGAVGTLLRTAQALQWQAVWFLPNTPDPFDIHVTRASQGALFHMPYMKGDLQELLAFVESRKMELCVAHGMGMNPEQHKFGKGCALLVRQEHVAPFQPPRVATKLAPAGQDIRRLDIGKNNPEIIHHPDSILTTAMRLVSVFLCVAFASDFDEMLVASLGNCPMCADAEPCLKHCHLDEQKPWEECLPRCMSDNPLVANTIYTMAKRAGSLREVGRVGASEDGDDAAEET